MAYASLRECVDDLSRHGHLVRIEQEVDADLEAAAIHRRVFQAGGPALYFARVKGCRFPMVSNLFGTHGPGALHLPRHAGGGPPAGRAEGRSRRRSGSGPLRYAGVPFTALSHAAPAGGRRARCWPTRRRLSELPQLKCWPRDGGPFITLPQVYTEDPDRPGPMALEPGHVPRPAVGQPVRAGPRGRPALPDPPRHRRAPRGGDPPGRAAAGERLRRRAAGDDAGGGDAAARGAVRAGVRRRAGRAAGAAGARGRASCRCTPTPTSASPARSIPTQRKPEGPFGDHLGYYSLAHDFPGAARRSASTTATDAIWPFTVVGRPPQEDTAFGELIHELTGPVIPTVLPGVKAVHAVDAAGVHPLLLAIGSERYVPYAAPDRAAGAADPGQRHPRPGAAVAGQVPADRRPARTTRSSTSTTSRRSSATCWSGSIWRRDLHFQTRTTIDTLDYSRQGAERGVEAGDRRRGPSRGATLATEVPAGLPLPLGFADPRVACPGVLAVRAPAFVDGSGDVVADVAAACALWAGRPQFDQLPAGGAGRRQRVRGAQRWTTSCG